MLYVLLAVVGLLAVVLIGIYNGLVKSKIRVDEVLQLLDIVAWTDIVGGGLGVDLSGILCSMCNLQTLIGADTHHRKNVLFSGPHLFWAN